MKEHFNRHELISTITPVIENTAMRYNLIPLEISLEKESNRWFLRIFIYSTDHNVSHLDCENLSRGMGDMLDELIPFKYYLEVSSPGVERTLKKPEHFAHCIGEKVEIKLFAPDKNGKKSYKGELKAANESGIEIEADGETVALEYSAVAKANTYFEF